MVTIASSLQATNGTLCVLFFYICHSLCVYAEIKTCGTLPLCGSFHCTNFGTLCVLFFYIVTSFCTSAMGDNIKTECIVCTQRSLWSEWRDLNSRPYGPEPYALPNCATPRYGYNNFSTAFQTLPLQYTSNIRFLQQKSTICFKISLIR